MFIGIIKKGEPAKITVATHKFTTGELINSTVTGYYIKMGDTFATKIAITFNIVPTETGIYFSEIDTTSLDVDTYLVVIKATIDGIDVATTETFVVNDVLAVYNEGVYNV